MVLFSFFTWWYGSGWAQVPREIRRRVNFILQFFSLKIILRTLFAPWKRDIAYARSTALEDRFQALIGNLVSRFIGFIIRVIFMFTAVLAIIFTVVFGVLLMIVWPALPFSPILFLYWGLL
ncbi:hypothetical protein IT414_02790 [bacterium]|nr:hypothetical protein [bacterium]